MDNSNHDDYTFTPHINAVSNEILKKENRRIVNVHERLFNEAKRKKKNLINNSFDVKRDFDRKHQINKKKNTKGLFNYFSKYNIKVQMK